VDCLTDTNIKTLKHLPNMPGGKSWQAGKNIKTLLPPTPGAVLEIFKELKINRKNKKITIIGQGQLVGRPLTIILRARGLKVDTCNSKTKNIKAKCLAADIIVTAVGKYKLLTADMVKRGAVVIDTGIVFVNHQMKGDVDFENVKKKASWITPVPGGVGPITVSLLLANTLKCYKMMRIYK